MSLAAGGMTYRVVGEQAKRIANAIQSREGLRCK
jgi:hypothetical protein